LTLVNVPVSRWSQIDHSVESPQTWNFVHKLLKAMRPLVDRSLWGERSMRLLSTTRSKCSGTFRHCRRESLRLRAAIEFFVDEGRINGTTAKSSRQWSLIVLSGLHPAYRRHNSANSPRCHVSAKKSAQQWSRLLTSRPSSLIVANRKDHLCAIMARGETWMRPAQRSSRD